MIPHFILQQLSHRILQALLPYFLTSSLHPFIIVVFVVSLFLLFLLLSYNQHGGSKLGCLASV